jgi:hypothetical protein
MQIEHFTTLSSAYDVTLYGKELENPMKAVDSCNVS